MKLRLLIFAVIVSAALPAVSAQEGVNWYSIDQVDELLKTNPKPVFIDAYTDWCGWCKKLDKDTFSDPVIASYLNENYIPVKFDAESKEPVTFMGRQFINDGKSGRTHQLAVALLPIQGRIGYPTVVFLNEKGELLTPVSGYKTPRDMEPMLVFFAEKHYLKSNWEEFMKTFKGSYQD